MAIDRWTYTDWKRITDNDLRLDIKLKLEHSILPAQLERIDSEDWGVIISFNELGPANALFALPRLYFMVLHSAGRICSSTVHITEL